MANYLASVGLSAGLLGEHGHGTGLVQEPELSVLVLLVGGVEEDAAVEQSAMHVTNHGANVTKGILLARLSLTGRDRVKVLLDPRGPLGAVALRGKIGQSSEATGSSLVPVWIAHALQ
jgi:hypothetical protein